MTLDYQKLGFRCGLEIHQQLETNKLFCDCPSIVRDEKPDISFTRKLRPVVGETGEIDIAAKHEMKKAKKFKYKACSTSCCLVEMDEEPPHLVNKHALHTALIIAKLLNAKIVDEIQFMRKTVIDGSNVSGFQRTALIATDGYIETSKGKINIPVICLEEEAAKKIKQEKDSTTYRLDRLGIPLVEIATDASIKDPEHAKETASLLGMILRSTERVKRGLGTIRQDVNVSIKGGARTEVKGFQDLRSIPKVIENEIKRQNLTIKKGTKLEKEVRKAESDFSTTFLRPMPGAARMYPETDVMPTKITKNLLDMIEIPELITDKAINLEKQYKLSPALAKEIIKENINLDFFIKQNKRLKPAVIANILIEIPKEIKTRLNLNSSKLKKQHFIEVLEKLNNNEISKEAVIEILSEFCKGKKPNYSRYKTIDTGDIEKEIKKIVEKNKSAPFGALMGMCMSKFRGKVNGKIVSDLLKKYSR